MNVPELDILKVVEEKGGVLVLGNVTFFIDEDGPWQGCLSYDRPRWQWDVEGIKRDLTALLQGK